jgi:hypothetical protein
MQTPSRPRGRHRLRSSAQILVLVVSLPISAVAQTAQVPQATSRATPIPPGIWKADAYAELLAVDSNRYVIYDLTAVSCVAADSGASLRGRYPRVELEGPATLVVSGVDYRYSLRRLPGLPRQCRTPVAPSRRHTFDAFWHYFKENYPFFDRRGIDWDALREPYRERIRDDMSEADLFAIMGELVERINDPHVFLSNGKAGADARSYGSPEPHGVAAALRSRWPGQRTSVYNDAGAAVERAIETMIRYEILGGRFETAHNERLVWGWLADSVAYLRVSLSVGLFAHGTSREQMYEQYEATLDRVFAGFRGARALLVDVTTNTGGATFVATGIARRVIQEPTTTWTTSARTSDGGRIAPFIERLDPSPRPGFDGPVLILISGNTVSAGESLPLALRGLPNVTLFGERTLGAHSSFMMKTLPGGGVVGVPNEIVVDRTGVSFEARGIPPDVHAVVFDPDRPVSGFRSFVESAARYARTTR